MKLRDYQRKAIQAIHDELGEHQRTLLVLATGLGKTACAAHVIKDRKTNGRSVFIAHREELIYQAQGSIGHITGQTPDIEMASQWADQAAWRGWQADTVVTSVQTQCSGRNGDGRMTRFEPLDFGTAIADEAHRSVAASWRRVLDHYCSNPNLKLLGLTATPNRHDEAALGKVFQSCAFNYGIHEGIQDGWLVPIDSDMPNIEGLDLSRCKTTAGDFNAGDLGRQLLYEKPLIEMADTTRRLSDGRRTVIFAASVAHAERFCEILNRYEPGSARFVYAKTPKDERRIIYRDFRNGEFRFLLNVFVLGEGWDEPSVEVIVMARPTKSTTVYQQCLGRGTRPLPGVVDFLNDESDQQHIVGPDGQALPATLRRQAIKDSAKPKLLIIDFVGNSGHHKVIRAIDVLGGNYDDDVVERAIADASQDGRQMPVQERLDEAQRNIKQDRERAAAQRAKIVGRAIFTSRRVNIFDVADQTPHRQFGWDKSMPASDKQSALLRKFKIPCDDMTKAEASRLLGTIFKRKDAGLCTPGQLGLLGKYGIDGTKLSFETASGLITAIKANGWHRLGQETVVGIIDVGEAVAAKKRAERKGNGYGR